MGRGNVGWVGVGGGFLDFCCRKKPPVRGRAERGRVSKGAAKESLARDSANPASRRRGGRAGRRIESWAFFVLFVWAGLGREYAYVCSSEVSCPAR